MQLHATSQIHEPPPCTGEILLGERADIVGHAGTSQRHANHCKRMSALPNLLRGMHRLNKRGGKPSLD